MKKTFITIGLFFAVVTGFSQEFDKSLTSARTAYASKDFSNARFAMTQMLGILDEAIAKEILKMLPTKLGAMDYKPKEDQLTGGSSGYAGGLFVNRFFGNDPKTASIEIVNNSPFITSINAFLNMPMIGMGDSDQKSIKVQGYKGILRKQVGTDDNKLNFELQIPFNNTLLTLKVNDTTENEITQFADAIPLSKLANVAQ
jgi:hypothetical protein